jgi:transposase
MTQQNHNKPNNAKPNTTKPNTTKPNTTKPGNATPSPDKLSDHMGIDVSKRQLDYSFGKGLRRETIPNTTEGHARIVAACAQRPGLRVVCEATGGYERNLVKALRKAGIETHVVMPLKVKCLAIATGQMAKTDRIDADKLALFSEKIEIKPSHAATEHEEKLRELVQCRKHLVERLVQLAGRRENAGERMLALLAKEEKQTQRHLDKIEKEIEQCISGDETSSKKIERMCQVKGVGRTVAACVLAHMPELGAMEDKTAAALGGLAPYPNQSGPVEKPSRIRGGRHEVRLALYPAAMCAMRHNPVLRRFNERLKERGKPGLVRVVAVMRKLLCLLNKICSDPHFSPLT